MTHTFINRANLTTSALHIYHERQAIQIRASGNPEINSSLQYNTSITCAYSHFLTTNNSSMPVVGHLFELTLPTCQAATQMIQFYNESYKRDIAIHTVQKTCIPKVRTYMDTFVYAYTRSVKPKKRSLMQLRSKLLRHIQLITSKDIDIPDS